MSPCAKLLPAALLTLAFIPPARASDFTSFAEDQNTCRQAATRAIQGAIGPAAAQRYDRAHDRCMVTHGRMRELNAAAPDPDLANPGNPHSFDFPDAYYSVPYASPGYGYDGFSY